MPAMSSARMRHWLGAGLVALAAAWAPAAHAIFGDDEARKAIIDLRQQVEANKLASDAAAKEARDNDAAIKRSLLELSNQIEQLRREIAGLRGQNEQLAREVAELQRAQKDVQAGMDERLGEGRARWAQLQRAARREGRIRSGHGNAPSV